MRLLSTLVITAALCLGGSFGAAGFATGAQAQSAPTSKTEAVKKKKTKAIKVSTKAQEEAEQPARKPAPFMFGLFNARKPEPAVLTDEQLDNDKKLAALSKRRPVKLDERYQKQEVRFSGYQPGTIVIDTKEKLLYFVESPTTAIRYGVAVGKEGLLFTGKVKVGAKQVWPSWTPTKEMVERSPSHYKRYEDGMDGGLKNPLGARAIYLYQGRNDTYLRIHGTNQPNSIGHAASNGCFRMLNEHVIDLYDRVQMGATVVVL